MLNNVKFFITLLVLFCCGYCLAAQKVDGIDVSHHQGHIDWKSVAKGNDLQFVYIKATEGATCQDSQYATNCRNARKNGIKTGAYHFFTMSSTPKQQFDNFKSVVGTSMMDLVPMIDIELYKNKKGFHVGKYYTNNAKHLAIIKDNIKAIVKLFEDYYGCKPMIYCTCNSYNELVKNNVKGCPLYLGHYADSPGVSGYTIWQYSEKGKISGYSKCVDVCKFAKGKTVKDIEWHSENKNKKRVAPRLFPCSRLIWLLRICPHIRML